MSYSGCSYMIDIIFFVDFRCWKIISNLAQEVATEVLQVL